MIRQARALAMAEARILLSSKWLFAALLITPLMLVFFTRSTFALVLRSQGYADASGAEQAIPGMAVMFAFFAIGTIGDAFFREYSYKTWDRLRVAGVGAAVLLGGKLGPYVVLIVAQQVALLAMGDLMFGLDTVGPSLGLLVVAISLALVISALSMTVIAFARNVQQVVVVQYVGTMVLAGLGGVLAAPELLPAWIRPLMPVSPSYWAMRAYRSLLLDHQGLAAIVGPVSVLLGMTALLTAVSSVRFRLDETKSADAI